MASLNERIKELRKSHSLSQKDFATKIGISQRSVSWSEQPGNNVPDSTIKSLCMAFNVNEDWLRNGTEPMCVESSTFSLEEFVKERGGGELEIEALKAYFELEPDIRKELMKKLIKHGMNASGDTLSDVAETEAAYIKSRSNHVQKTVQSALNTSADTTNPEEKESINRASNQ